MTERRTVHEGRSASPYFVADATLQWKPPIRGLRVTMKITNTGDVAYADPSGEEHAMATIPQAGRTWRVRLDYRVRPEATE